MSDLTRFFPDLVPCRAVSSLVAVVAVFLGGCSAAASDGRTTPTPTPTPTPASAGAVAEPPVLTGGLAFPRTLQADRRVEVRLDGAVGDAWRVTSAVLDSGFFAPVAVTDHTVPLFEGWTARVPVPLGDATCPIADASARVALTLASEAGGQSHATVELPTDVLAQINETECATRAITQVAAPHLGNPEAAEGTSVQTTLTLRRGEAGAGVPVELTGAKGSVIFDVEPRNGAVLPVALGPDDAGVTVPVTITATRCDAHAFAESKKTFVFAVWIAVDGAEPAYVEVRPDEALKGALQEAFDACGAG